MGDLAVVLLSGFLFKDIHLVDASNPAFPRVVNQSRLTGVLEYGLTADPADPSRVFTLRDFAVPSALVLVQYGLSEAGIVVESDYTLSSDPERNVSDLLVRGGYAFISWDDSLRIYDFDPETTHLSLRSRHPYVLNQLAMHGPWLFGLDNQPDKHLYVFDATVGHAPVLRLVQEVTPASFGLQVLSPAPGISFLYVHGANGFEVYDLAGLPAVLHRRGSFCPEVSPGGGSPLAIAGNRLVLADGAGGVYLLQGPNPTTSVADPPLARGTLRAGPNPSAGDVWIRFAEGDGVERVDVLDVRGRLVRSLTREDGATTMRWDGRDAVGRRLGPGVYFLRASATTGSSASSRIVLLAGEFAR